MWLKAFRRVPWWVWPGWLLHLGAYGLRSYDTSAGHECARVALGFWFNFPELANLVRQTEWQELTGTFTLGWFNVTNAAAVFLPLGLMVFRTAVAAWWAGLLNACGAGLAAGFATGAVTGESAWDELGPGFFVWSFSYVWLAVAGFAVARRRRPAATHGAASADSGATSARGPG